MSQPTPAQHGFTLIEAMIALVILGITAAAVVRAVESHIDTVYSLERRAAAQWVAENALAETALNYGQSSGMGEQEMLGRQWAVRTAQEGSEDPDLLLVTAHVTPSGESEPLVSLRGFVDRGTVTR